MARLSIRIGKVPEGAAALGDRVSQHRLDGVVQPGGAGLADSRGARGRTNPRKKQDFRGVDVSHADHRLSSQQQRLDSGRPSLEALVKHERIERIAERLDAEPPKQLLCRRVVLVQGMNHGAEAPWVMQAQGAPAGDKVKVIVFACRWQVGGKTDAARHSKVHQEQARAQVEQQVLTAAAYGQHLLAVQLCRLAAQWPAKRLAHQRSFDVGTCDAIGKAQAGDFNFGQFGHGVKALQVDIKTWRHENMGLEKPCTSEPRPIRSGMAGCGALQGGFNYHGLMKKTPGIAFACLCLIAPLVLAQASPPQPFVPASPVPGLAEARAVEAAASLSSLDGELFYQLLVGELTAQQGEAAAGFSLLLDAARKTGDVQLYQRATEIALQARSGDAALQAALAWKQQQPDSREANRYVLQILIALNRIADTAEPLKAEFTMAPPAERTAVLAAIPRAYARASDRKLAASVVETALAGYLADPATASAAWTAVGRMRLAANDKDGAMDAARRGQAVDPRAEGPVVVALDLIEPQRPEAEALVRKYLAEVPGQPKAQPEIRMAYARVLLDAQRYAEAGTQLQTVTRERPDYPEAWLVLGSLQLQDNQQAASQASLERYVALAGQGPQQEQKPGLVQAYLSLSQLSEKRKDYAAAEGWLGKIESTADLTQTQTRRASILASQGKIEEGLRLIRALPDRTPEEARLKLNAEVGLLREVKQYRQAHELLGQALAKTPEDTDLLYEQSMMAEKLGSLDEMERLLRQVIQLKPDHHHAYNALGYSLADRNVRLPEARDLIRKAIEFAPTDPFIKDSLGWVEFRMGNKAEAARIFEAAYKARPDAEIAAHFGEVLWSLDQRDRALSIWKEGQLINADNETLLETLKRLKVAP